LDKVLWKSNNDKVCPFSVKTVWSDLSTPKPVVPVPWVVNWNKVDVLKCPLCCFIKDDHDHLFFGCDYSIKVWKNFKGLMRLDVAPDNLFSIVDYISSRPIGKSIWSIIQRLVLGATSHVEGFVLVFSNSQRVVMLWKGWRNGYVLLWFEGCSWSVLNIFYVISFCKWEICNENSSWYVWLIANGQNRKVAGDVKLLGDIDHGKDIHSAIVIFL
ncbi:hypothetical protein Tco_1544788, partial [Tanacetum coccineum]